MTQSWLGMDVGGSKIHIRIEDSAGQARMDAQWPTGRWGGESYAFKAARMAELIALAAGQAGLAAPPRAIGIGAHGCDTPDECTRMTALMAGHFPDSACQVVNDAALVALCASQPHAAGLIAGTGSVAAALGPEDHWLLAGGWGWLVGDEGGASGLVREGIRAVLTDWDRGRSDDPLAIALTRAFGADHLLDLPSQLLRQPVSVWSRHASVIFECMQAGSPLAAGVVDAAAESLAELIARLCRRGARIDCVVAAGGVIRHQPPLFDRLAARLRKHDPRLSLLLLACPPVMGGVALARRLVAPSLVRSVSRGA
ncbi:ATPase [Rahnella aquatilis]|nr:ATPase [Rahnella aquatilis]